MRRFILGQIVASLAAVAIFLGSFAIFDVWQKSLEAKVAAMAIASGGLLIAIFLFRLLVKNREWDWPVDVAFAAAACAMVTLMGLAGALVAMIAISAGSIIVSIRALKDFAAGDRKWSWQSPAYLLWGQFLAIFVFLLWLGVR